MSRIEEVRKLRRAQQVEIREKLAELKICCRCLDPKKKLASKTMCKDCLEGMKLRARARYQPRKKK